MPEALWQRAAAERISVELDAVAPELADVKRRAEALDRGAQPYPDHDEADP